MYLPTPDLWLGIRDMFWHEEGCTIDRRKPLTQESARSKVERGSSNALGGPIGSRQAELFVACTSIYQRGGCVRALPKMLHCRQQLCKRQCLVGWLVARKAAQLAPTSHRSDLPSLLLFLQRSIEFTFLCYAWGQISAQILLCFAHNAQAGQFYLLLVSHFDEICRKTLDVHLDSDCSSIIKIQNLSSYLIISSQSALPSSLLWLWLYSHSLCLCPHLHPLLLLPAPSLTPTPSQASAPAATGWWINY